MESSDLLQVISQFEQAIARFDESLSRDIDKDDVFLDAAVQRFEFCFELAWKAMKRVLADRGIDTRSPKETLRAAFKQGWCTEGDDFWVRMLEDRNLTSHTYDQKLAHDVYTRVKTYAPAFTRLSKLLRKEVEDSGS